MVKFAEPFINKITSYYPKVKRMNGKLKKKQMSVITCNK